MHARHCCQLSLRKIALGPALSVRLMDSQIKGVKKARGVPLEILGGGMPPCSLNPDPISDQKMSFSTPVFRPDLENPYPFSDLAFRQKSCHHYLGESATKKINSSNPSHIRIFLFISYSFGTETINTFVHPPSSLENHTRFQTKMGKIYTRFQTNKLYGYDKKKVLQYCKSYLKLIIDSF